MDVGGGHGWGLEARARGGGGRRAGGRSLVGGGRGVWRGRARCDSHVRPAPRGPGRQVFPLPAAALHMLAVFPALGAAVGELPGVTGRPSSRGAGAQGVLRGCAPAARLRLLRSKITAREPGLHCAPLYPPPLHPALPATARAGEPGRSARGTQALGLVSGLHGFGCTWGGPWGRDVGGPGSHRVGSSIAES